MILVNHQFLRPYLYIGFSLLSDSAFNLLLLSRLEPWFLFKPLVFGKQIMRRSPLANFLLSLTVNPQFLAFKNQISLLFPSFCNLPSLALGHMTPLSWGGNGISQYQLTVCLTLGDKRRGRLPLNSLLCSFSKEEHFCCFRKVSQLEK